jgi:hypothetical protein
MNSASLCSLAGRYDNPITPRFLAPIDCLKIPALYNKSAEKGFYVDVVCAVEIRWVAQLGAQKR